MRQILATAILLVLTTSVLAAAPKLTDPEDRFEITLFADESQVKNPIGVQADERGRVYVIESHTHFRPKEYDGPKGDRILVLEDTNGDGRAETVEVFHEGFQYSMDLLLQRDGKLLVATRSSIHRLFDQDKDGKADREETIIQLDTPGNYPHNGLSGLAYDHHGGLYFGLGENLGAPYKLIGSDKTTLSGEAEGGSVYHCQLDGSKLRRVATGVWNPFGICVDSAGNVFGTDNDPDSSPPCRLLHIVEGGDYGYEFRYGRSGLHIFQCWNGELPGTLPMITGTGEAPCEIMPYDGGLLVASWADNRLEHYRLKPKGASFELDKRTILVNGDMNFRPVGIAAEKDGTLYVSDWATASYELTGKGRIWKLRRTKPLSSEATSAVAPLDWQALTKPRKRFSTLKELKSDDPFVRSATIQVLALRDRESDGVDGLVNDSAFDNTQRLGMLLAMKRSGNPAYREQIPAFLNDADPTVRFSALKWIADDKLAEFKSMVEAGLNRDDLTRELFAAHLAALERIEYGRVMGNRPDAKLVLKTLTNEKASPRLRAFALVLLPSDHGELTINYLKSLLKTGEPALQLEVLRTMSAAPTDERRELLGEIAADEQQSEQLRAEAIVGLAGDAKHKDVLIGLAIGDNQTLRDEALRSLVEMPLSDEDKQRLARLKNVPEASRVIGEMQATPPLNDLAAWQERLSAEGDAEAGRRIFFHSKVGYCARCHTYDGRGNVVGPELTKIHERGRDFLLTAIVQPSRDVAPAYRQWNIELTDGRTMAGISLRKGSHSEDYLGPDGKPFTVKLAGIESRRESETSIMPEGLPQTLTAIELRDLIAFLSQPQHQ